MLELFQKVLEDKKNNQNEDLTQIIAKFGQKLNSSENEEQI